MEELIKEDDVDKILSVDVITDNKKPGTHWLLTYYDDKIDYEYIKSNLKSFPHIKCFVFQLEFGEITNKKHFHACVSLDISDSKPLPQFKKRFPNVHVQIIKNVKYYQSYCCKFETCDKEYNSFYYGINSAEIECWEKLERNEKSLLEQLFDVTKNEKYISNLLPIYILNLNKHLKEYKENLIQRDILKKTIENRVIDDFSDNSIDLINKSLKMSLEYNICQLDKYEKYLIYLLEQIDEDVILFDKLNQLISHNLTIEEERVWVLKSDIEKIGVMKVKSQKLNEENNEIIRLKEENKNLIIKNGKKLDDVLKNEVKIDLILLKLNQHIDLKLNYKNENLKLKLNNDELESQIKIKNIAFKKMELLIKDKKLNSNELQIEIDKLKLSLEDKRSEIKDKNNELENKNNELENKNNELENKNKKLKKLESIKLKNEELESEIENKNIELKDKNKKIKKLESKIENLEINEMEMQNKIIELENKNKKLELKIKILEKI
jgi:hypothetical protein